MTSTGQPLSSYSPDACMFCHQPLRIATGTDTDSEPEDPLERGEPATVIDDVELYCGTPGSGPGGHHAHWTCLIDHALQGRARSIVPTPVQGGGYPPAFTTCAVCGQNLLDPDGRFVVDVRNEGGETRGFDFGAIIEEELFLDTNPDLVRNRAFHDFVAEGDYEAAGKLVAEQSVDINCRYGEDGLTALQKAMFSGDMRGVEFLTDLGATM